MNGAPDSPFQGETAETEQGGKPLKTALVLEGGGIRGTYTAGVLDVFLEEGIVFPYVIGSSAGACNACSYLSGQKGRQYTINTKYLDKRYAGFWQLMKNGSFMNMDYLFHTLPTELVPFDFDAFDQNHTTFYATATNCYTGMTEYFEKEGMDRFLTPVRASSSLPLMTPMVVWKKAAYLDGGLTDPIPFQRALEDGNDRVVAVLTRPQGYVKKKPDSFHAIKSVYKEFPQFVAAVKERPQVYNGQTAALTQLEGQGKAFVLRPSESIQMGRVRAKPEQVEALYQLGQKDARDNLPALKQFLLRGDEASEEVTQ